MSPNVTSPAETLHEMNEVDSGPVSVVEEAVDVTTTVAVDTNKDDDQASPSVTNGNERTVRFSVGNEVERRGHSNEPDEHTTAFNLKSWRSNFS